MMNIGPAEAKALSFWEYEALLWNWNDAHALDDEGDAPDPGVVMPMLDRINADPRLTGARETVN